MFLTAPLSFTTAKALDFVLGGESVTRYSKSQLKSLLSIHGTQVPDPQLSGSKRDGSGPDDDDEPDTFHDNAVVVTERTRDNVTVVELPQISSRISPPVDAFSPVDSNPSNAICFVENPVNEQVLDEIAVEPQPSASRHTASNLQNALEGYPAESSPSNSSAINETDKSRFAPLSKLYNLTKFHTGEKAARKDKEREKKERDSVTSNPPLTKDEMAMLGGAFDFSQKTVAQVMTALDDVFMLEASLSLNFEVLLLIFQSGHSRIPVYDKVRENIIGVMFTKDLILLDPEDSVPIKTILLFFSRTVLLVFFDTPLNLMLNIFKQGRGHLAIVQQKNPQKPGEDSVPDTMGVVTLEDLIEELIGQDIVDETDVYTDNISKKRVKRVRSFHPEVLKMFDSRHHEEMLSDNEVLVVASYLSNNTSEFSSLLVKLSVLKEMLAELPIVEYRNDNMNESQRDQLSLAGLLPGKSGARYSEYSRNAMEESQEVNNPPSQGEPSCPSGTGLGSDGAPRQRAGEVLYTRGVPTKSAILIINGKLEICAGNDGFISEAGPWTLLATSALTDDLYAPDFTARVTEYPTRLLRIPRKLYRLMVQYSGNYGGGEGGPGLKGKLSPLTHEGGGGKERRVSESSERNRSSSSLAMAAAAAAVAVGNPRHSDGRPRLPGTASDAVIVKKSRTRPNGQSIEWSELEPLGVVVDGKAGGGSSGEGRAAGVRTLAGKRRNLVHGVSEDKPPSRPTASASGEQGGGS